ncbi:MAG: chorismate-binding protein [Polaribacter sp.]|uniref:chorismate-binding protein n=1 Tax=Polaribacter sp. TaxID=1920175 RepID=UPI0032630182
MSIIFSKIEEHYKSKMPFVGYRKPNSTTISGFFMNSDELCFSTEFKESGFVFAPFNSEEKAVLFPFDAAEVIEEHVLLDEDFLLNNRLASKNENDKFDHIHLIEKSLDEINKNQLKKVVVSRNEKVELKKVNVLITFKKLLNTYANAFVYVWYHPKVGLWFGATPETLLNITKNNFETMSLAGTQVYKKTEQVIWKSKELEEQQLVTNFIENQLKSISINLKIDKTETVKAGSLLHLKTKVEGVLKEESSLKELIRSLHPTPAVCGLPRDKARDFINLNENYKRSYYTGFLGELNIYDEESSLFVNLRCMNIEDGFALIYIGGGITKDSNAKKEWEETVAKSKTMKKVL